MLSFVKSLAEIAVIQSKHHIEEINKDDDDRMTSTLHEQCLQYLARAEGKIASFVQGFEASLPATLSY